VKPMKRSCENSENADARRLRKRPLGNYRYVRLRWRVLFTAVDFIGTWLCRFVQVISSAGKPVRRPSKAVEKPRHSNGDGLGRPLYSASGYPRRILLIQLDHFGDAVITTAMLPPLRSRYPEASIEVLASEANREVFEAAPEVDCIHVSTVNRFARRGLTPLAWIAATFRWGLRLRRRNFDLGIDVRGDFPAALILWLCGARRRVGWAAGGGGFLLTDSPPYVFDRPEVDSRAALLAELGIEAEDLRPQFRPTEEARREIRRQLYDGLPRPSDADGSCTCQSVEPPGIPASWRTQLQYSPLAVLHIGSGTPAKRWPVEYWRQLAGRLVVEHAAQLVLVGGNDDCIVARKLLGGHPWPGVIDWTGRLRIVELAALLEEADVLVGADSGPAQLAAAVNTPAVVLFSGTNRPRQWQPRGKEVTVLRHQLDCSPCHRERCPRPGHPCMRGLLPERVLAEIVRVLRRRNAVPRPPFDKPSDNGCHRRLAGASAGHGQDARDTEIHRTCVELP